MVPPVKMCTDRQTEGRVYCEEDGVWTCWPCPLWKKLPFHQRHNVNELLRRVTTGCWVVRLQEWHPWLVFKTSLVLRNAVAWGPCFVTFAVPNMFKYPVWGQEPGYVGWHTHDRTADWETDVQSGLYHAVGTSGHTVKCHIISVVLRLYVLQTGLLFLSIYKNFVEIINTSGTSQLGISI